MPLATAASLEDSKMKRKYYALSLLLPLVIFLGSCSNKDAIPGGSGLIEATEVTISAETAGQLKALYFAEGDAIRSGDTVGIIDTVTVSLRLQESYAVKKTVETRLRTSALAIEQADQNLELARKEFERVSALLKSGSANQQQFDKTETAFNLAQLARKTAVASYEATQAELTRAQASIEILRKQLSDCYPVSAQAGIIVSKYIEAGELVAPGKQLLRIAKLDTVWGKIYLPPSDLTRFTLRNSAYVDPEDGRAEPLKGYVSWISSEAEFTPKNVQTKEARADLVYAVKILIPNPDGALKIGMPVSAEIR